MIQPVNSFSFNTPVRRTNILTVALLGCAQLTNQVHAFDFGGVLGGAGAASSAPQQAHAQAIGTVVLPAPFAQAAIWASELPALRICDNGIDDAAGCPGRPEHGGAGFLSTVFTWKYALNNLRALVVVAARSDTISPPPEGTAEMIVQLLDALDQLLEQPIVDAVGRITQMCRSTFNQLRDWLVSQSPVMLRIGNTPSQSIVGRYAWPSDGKTALGQATFTLRTGAKMPAVGFGTWRLWAKEAYQPVLWALQAGYRHIDTAEGYANEAEIGRAIVDSGIPRSELFIATKLSSVPRGLADISHTADIFAMQLAQLGTDYVDMYMLHTPPNDMSQLQTLWSILETFYEQGRARALGVSNCDVNDLRAIFSFAKIPPVYIQNLFKIYKPGEQMPMNNEDVVAFAQANQITVMGYSGQTEWPHVMPPLEDPHVLAVAVQVGRTPSQVLHRWALQRGIGVIPKSSSKERIIENSRLLDFELSESLMRYLDGLATLSESGAATIKPSVQEDLFSLKVLSAGVQQPQQQQQPLHSWDPSAGHGSAELLAATKDQGFQYTAIRDHLLGAPINLPPGGCREACLAEQRCAAWEVCAPYNPQAGCEGCYLIGQAVPTVRVEGWHAAVERTR
eukprot:TRINITY_DN5924_c0_g7_i1.p1 TRINITY_DN5924_c0_g7~~TRINITY_DN5924_c0_g7_i1.p1  ORF type:complete len:621 (-),score=94.23 TRINITY_DN5924_c0_g7_i1:69-1931(-)